MATINLPITGDRYLDWRLKILIDWSNWKPGDPASADIASEKGWLNAGLKMQSLDFPGSENLDLDAISKIVSAGLSVGAAEAKTVKQVVAELGIDREQASFLVHFAMCLAASQRDMESSGEIIGKMEWDGEGCCDICQKNHGKTIKIGSKFPSGHLMPPGCKYCICCLLPVIE